MFSDGGIFELGIGDFYNRVETFLEIFVDTNANLGFKFYSLKIPLIRTSEFVKIQKFEELHISTLKH